MPLPATDDYIDADNRRAAPFAAGKVNKAAMLPGNIIAHRKAKHRASADFLGGEKRIEHLAKVLLFNAMMWLIKITVFT